MTTTLDRASASAALGSPAYAQAVASLHEGRPFTLVLADDPAERAALLQAVLESATDKGTRIVRVGNPLRSALTIDRMFLQAAGPEAEIRHERDGKALARKLAGPVGDETRLIVVIEQPETLDADALGTLQAIAPSFEHVVPRVHLLFCGPVAFGAKLKPPTPADPTPVPMPRSRRPRPVVTVLSVTAGAVAGAAVLVWERHPELFHFSRPGAAPSAALQTALPIADVVAPSAAMPAPAPLASQPAPPAPADAPAPVPAALVPAPRLADDSTVLRRAFERFLAARPELVHLSDNRKDELFQEFLDRRRLRGGAGQ